MRPDLDDAYAAVDWAKSQFPVLEQEIKSWNDSPAFLLVDEPRPEMGKRLFKLEINRRLPATINAGAGSVINSIRTALDLLAASLARRNGKSPNADRHFPIYESFMDFIDPLKVAERKKWLSPLECQIIESLHPYQGGNDLLFALHKIDITRKHDRLVQVRLVPSSISVTPDSLVQGLEFPALWQAFEHGAIIAWTNIDAASCDFHIATEVTLHETGLIEDQPLVAALRQFAGTVDSIIQRFE
jgi:hypothetical protein